MTAMAQERRGPVVGFRGNAAVDRSGDGGKVPTADARTSNRLLRPLVRKVPGTNSRFQKFGRRLLSTGAQIAFKKTQVRKSGR
jgi:hypothetical protein